MSGPGKSDTHESNRLQPPGEAALDLKNVSLRTVLMVSLMAMVLLPGLGHGPVRAAELQLVSDRTRRSSRSRRTATWPWSSSASSRQPRTAQLDSLARTVFSKPANRAKRAIPGELERQAAVLDCDYLLWIGTDGTVWGSTTGQVGHKLDWAAAGGCERARAWRRRSSRSSRRPSCTRLASTRSTGSRSPTAPTAAPAPPRSSARWPSPRWRRCATPSARTSGRSSSLDMLKHNAGFVDQIVKQGRRTGVDLPERRRASPRRSRAATASASIGMPGLRRGTLGRPGRRRAVPGQLERSPTSPTSRTTSRSRIPAAPSSA